jgi:histidine kinase 2/3/4 (cytokinin receptor)
MTFTFQVPFTWVFSSRFEATRRIRQMESQANEQMNGESMVEGGTARKGLCHIPILAMTADVIHATHDECLKCGMDGYVSKPFEEENLYQAVARFFDSKSTLKS